MSRRKPVFSRPSLVQHFDAPDQYIGAFGWLCGYSADSAFLTLAAERFSRQTERQRARAGSVALAVMLDAGNPAITLIDAPGVAHLPLTSDGARDFKLMHAKVALLGFRHEADAMRWRVRLLVSTGNWTRQTMEESLDLAWCMDVTSEELHDAVLAESPDADLLQRCADLAAARSLMDWLAERFDTRLLEAGLSSPPSDTATGRRRLSDWLGQCSKYAGSTVPRFFDNRKSSLLEQLVSVIPRPSSPVARNALVMGSGFYESPKVNKGDAGVVAVPSALTRIVDSLRAAGALIKRPSLEVIVDPDACQAVACAAAEMRRAGYTIRAAGQPKAVFGAEQPRVLHAKFIFSAQRRTDSARCLNPWLYLGSGNLTRAGFLLPAGASSGNLEAGVVFDPGPLTWQEVPGEPPGTSITHLLPVQWESEVTPSQPLQPGGDMPDRVEAYLAPPVAWLTWRDVDNSQQCGELICDHATKPFQVLDPFGQPCVDTGGRALWQGTPPRLVTVQWAEGARTITAAVPVVDRFGRIAATALPRLELSEVWSQLSTFPMQADDDDPDDIDTSGRDGANSQPAGPSCGTYPIRDMMELVENIAAWQSRVPLADWTAWCCRLRQTLMVAADSEGVRAFHALGLNPLAPLTAAPFRPSFAESGATDPGKVYEAVLDEVAKAWGVDHMVELGNVNGVQR
ncbi:hypothetical protein K6V92_23105 [Cupriavidus respiraculi]|uniref:hypothetical protein n=1 Tax=Cupriavidus respiraculi TaxID=195930 RepID=UPI001C98DD67|nr:hypothetical protein [Cupriavidus respiraculi]MBY4949496.1 hypothetical protein [Cupriavidus respiraculi]